MRALFVVVLSCLIVFSPTANATTGPDPSKLQPNTIRVAEYVKAHYPEVPAINGWRMDPLPDHPSGRAVDIMIPYPALGDRILSDLMSRPKLGISYAIWRQRLHRPNGTGYHMRDRGDPRQNHYDHIHVTTYG